MATFEVLTSTGIDSNWLFPALRGGSFTVVTHTATDFTIKYNSLGKGDPSAGLLVNFSGTNFTYDGNFNPTAGTFNTIHLLLDGKLIDVELAAWALAPLAIPLTLFNDPGIADTNLGGGDTLTGGAGPDIMRGYDGDDIYVGKGGDDTFILNGGFTDVQVHGSNLDGSRAPGELDTIRLLGLSSVDLDNSDNIDRIVFATQDEASIIFNGNDASGLSSKLSIKGDGHANGLVFDGHANQALVLDLSEFTFSKWSGKADGVHISGGSVDDIIIGSRVNDTILTGEGDDQITGGLGRDFMVGGGDNDTFIYRRVAESKKGVAHRDTISNFEHGSDLISLAGVDGSSKKGFQHFRFIGDDPFHHKKSELHYVTRDDTSVILAGDRNGDGKADFQIEITGVNVIQATDLIIAI